MKAAEKCGFLYSQLKCNIRFQVSDDDFYNQILHLKNRFKRLIIRLFD